MSKVSAMQAMREARYAASRTSRPAAPAPTAAPARKTAPAKPAGEQRPDALTGAPGESAVDTLLLPAAGAAGGSATTGTTADVTAADVASEADVPTEALCGHRSMNNRSCRRPAGHPERNHRYN